MSDPTGLRRYAQVFDAVAADYDRHRSGYPLELVDAALARAGLSAGARVLEVGCGTGKLTELLAARRLEVDAVDPGPRMLEQARARVGGAANIRFHLGRFESVELPDEAYDAVFSATAFHWVEPQVGWRKAAGHLRDGGLLALVTHLGVTDGATPGVDEEFRALLHEHAPDVTEAWSGQLSLARIAEIAREERGNASRLWDALMYRQHELAVDEAAHLFDGAEVEVALRTSEEAADELVGQFKTTSAWARVDPERRPALERGYRALVERHGGRITTALATVLMTATRAGRRRG